jgi:cobalt-zinc-cadmium efflux system outer membrane protein
MLFRCLEFLLMRTSHRVMSACLVMFAGVLALPNLVMSADTHLTIQQAYESALKTSPDIQAQEKRLNAFKAKTESVSLFSPQPPSLEGSYRSDSAYNNQGVREIEIGVSAPLWHWNERQHTQALREKELEAARLQLEQQKLELAGEVRRVFWDTLSAHMDIEIAQVRTTAAEQLLRDVKRRVDAGELAKTDWYQAQALLAEAQTTLSRAIDAFADISTEFSSLTGLPSSTLGGIHAEDAAVPETLRPEDHPTLQWAKTQVQLQTQNTELVKTQGRANPELGLALVSEKSGFGMEAEKSLRLSGRFPLGNTADQDSRVLEAQANQLQAELSMSKTEKTLLAKGRAAAGRVEVFKQLKNSTREQADWLKKTYLLSQKSFELGETDLPTLLRQELQAFEANRLAHKAEVEYAAKLSAYKQALGLLPEQAVENHQ